MLINKLINILSGGGPGREFLYRFNEVHNGLTAGFKFIICFQPVEQISKGGAVF